MYPLLYSDPTTRAKSIAFEERWQMRLFPSTLSFHSWLWLRPIISIDKIWWWVQIRLTFILINSLEIVHAPFKYTWNRMNTTCPIITCHCRPPPKTNPILISKSLTKTNRTVPLNLFETHLLLFWLGPQHFLHLTRCTCANHDGSYKIMRTVQARPRNLKRCGKFHFIHATTPNLLLSNLKYLEVPNSLGGPTI